MNTPKPKPGPFPRRPGLEAAVDPNRAQEQGSVRIKDLQPIRLATNRVQEGSWMGFPLTHSVITPTLFGGAAMLIKLGSETPVGDTVQFVPQFVIRLPFDTPQKLHVPEARAEAEQVAEMYITILNDWRQG